MLHPIRERDDPACPVFAILVDSWHHSDIHVCRKVAHMGIAPVVAGSIVYVILFVEFSVVVVCFAVFLTPYIDIEML
jgi:hypothetical protein